MESSYQEERLEDVKELPFTLKLEHAIQFGSKTVEQVVFSKHLKAKHMRDLPAMPENIRSHHYVPGIASMTSEPIALIEELAHSDFLRCVKVLTNFM